MSDAPTACDLPSTPVRAEPGDALAWAYETHRGAVLRFCRSLLGSAADAADATHETFVRVASRLEALNGKTEPYLIAVARNVCYDELRRRGRFTTGEQGDTPRRPLPDAEVEAISRSFVRDVLEQLSRRHRELLSYTAAGLSYGEIARHTGTSVSSVTSALWRARERAREVIDASSPVGAADSAGAKAARALLRAAS